MKRRRNTRRASSKNRIEMSSGREGVPDMKAGSCNWENFYQTGKNNILLAEERRTTSVN